MSDAIDQPRAVIVITGKHSMSAMVERVARAIGTHMFGFVDPVEAPNNWARSLSAARVAIKAMQDDCQ